MRFRLDSIDRGYVLLRVGVYIFKLVLNKTAFWSNSWGEKKLRFESLYQVMSMFNVLYQNDADAGASTAWVDVV